MHLSTTIYGVYLLLTLLLSGGSDVLIRLLSTMLKQYVLQEQAITNCLLLFGAEGCRMQIYVEANMLDLNEDKTSPPYISIGMLPQSSSLQCPSSTLLFLIDLHLAIYYLCVLI